MCASRNLPIHHNIWYVMLETQGSNPISVLVQSTPQHVCL